MGKLSKKDQYKLDKRDLSWCYNTCEYSKNSKYSSNSKLDCFCMLYGEEIPDGRVSKCRENKKPINKSESEFRFEMFKKKRERYFILEEIFELIGIKDYIGKLDEVDCLEKIKNKLKKNKISILKEIIAMEYLLCSAIYFDDGNEHVHQPVNIKTGYVICGRRHHNCYSTQLALIGIEKTKSNKYLEEIQGFLTNNDRFVNRSEGLKIARISQQIIEGEDYEGKNELFSEDLW